VEELAQSSRRYPTFAFEEWRPSGRDVLTVKGVKKAYGDKHVLHGVDLLVRKGDRLAIMGPNGIGKSTLLKIVMGEVEADAGQVAWGYETHPQYFAQDHKDQLGDPARTAHDWLAQFAPDKDIGWIRGRLALMLFTGDDPKKKVGSLSGGEAARLVFAKLALHRPNVLVLDEPTNHLDLESIEALVEGLQKYTGTLILVSHDRWFINQLATRIVDIEPEGITDYEGNYEEYVAFSGDDRLDVEKVVLKAKTEKKGKKTAAPAAPGSPAKTGEKSSPNAATRVKKVAQDRHAELMHLIEAAEGRIAEIDAFFASADSYRTTPQDEIRRLETERSGLAAEVAALMEEWERAEEKIRALR
jgi:ABC-type multidrug transport system ATPase subunit